MSKYRNDLKFLTEIDKTLKKHRLYQQIKDIKSIIYLFLMTRFAIFSVTYVGLVMFKFVPFSTASTVFPDNLWLNAWTGWDAGFYVKIASEGYLHGNTPWFPAYPFLIRIFNLVFINGFLSGVIVSNLAFFTGLVFMYKLVKNKFNEEIAWRTAFYLSIFPTSFFFCSVLSESTFLMFSVAAFYFAEKEKWWLTGLFGILTVLTRSIGLIIALPILLIYLYKRKFNLKQIKIDILPILFIPAGIIIFMGILTFFHQSPFSFISAQEAWGRALAPPWWDIVRAFSELSSYPKEMFLAGDYPVRMLSGFILTCTFLVISLLAFKFIEFSYSIYALLLVLVPLSSPSTKYILYSDMRFILVAFPVFILLGMWGKNRIIDTFIVVFSLLFLSLFSIWNGLGGWIS